MASTLSLLTKDKDLALLAVPLGVVVGKYLDVALGYIPEMRRSFLGLWLNGWVCFALFGLLTVAGIRIKNTFLTLLGLGGLAFQIQETIYERLPLPPYT